ncbi:hypothetical protein BKA82DRAFT_1001567, partial [Pisolithus tinctorius]
MEVPWTPEDEELSNLDPEGREVTTVDPVVRKVGLWMVCSLTPELLESYTIFSMPTWVTIPAPSLCSRAGSLLAHVKKPTRGCTNTNRIGPQDRGSWKYLAEASKKLM